MDDADTAAPLELALVVAGYTGAARLVYGVASAL
eukprot:CAMPEP_0185855724 /NCGR_PEP_ID=MMETSP1354-20130828/26666_1 /TAXON_ID=708628 /ORGANISM="Erythrolobus madagascarensis, Strain CCMP3276" /LENGTH=33 /DNA_ID= /DNA_START= /DNA_END= /DNA_ORIENTATION=